MPKLSQRHLTANSWSFVTVICIFICIYYICVYIICIIHDVIFSIYKSWTHWITDWMADDRLLRAVRPKFDPRCKFLFEWKGTKLSKRQKGHTVVILFDFYCYYHFFFSSSSSSSSSERPDCWPLGALLALQTNFRGKTRRPPPRPGHLIRWPDLIFFSLFLRLSVAVLDLFFPTHVTIDTTTTRKKGATWFLFWPMSTPPTPTNQQILADDCRPDRLSNKPREAILVGLRS